MFLSNFYKIYGMYFTKRFDGVSFTLPDGSIIKGYYYNTTTAPYNFCLENIVDLSTTYYSNGVIFGDGTTPPTISDYCLSGNIISGITMSSTRSATCTENAAETSVLYTITNNNTEAITIGEIGYIGYNQYYKDSTSTSSNSERLLLERTVLESPITIEAGGVGQITYTLRMNYPTA